MAATVGRDLRGSREDRGCDRRVCCFGFGDRGLHRQGLVSGIELHLLLYGALFTSHSIDLANQLFMFRIVGVLQDDSISPVELYENYRQNPDYYRDYSQA